MKRYLILACMLMVLLSGCSRAEVVWETVDDEIVQPVSAEAPMQLVFDVPEDASLLAQTIPAAGLDEAVRAVSGYSAEELRAVLRDQAGRCSFGWYVPEADGGRLCHAEILSDRDYYYALTFSVREDTGTTYHSTEQQVFASFGLVS